MEDKKLKLENEDEEKKDKKRKIIILLLLFLMLSIIAFTLTYSFNNRKPIGKQIIDTINDVIGIDRVSTPVISEGSSNWVKEAVIKIIKDSDSNRKIEYYEYCVSDKNDTTDCNWIRTDTKNATITENGHKYVFFRAVTDNNKKSSIVSTEVFIDNNGPIVNGVSKLEDGNNLVIIVDAQDDLGGIEKYLYSLDGIYFFESNENYYIFTDTDETTKIVYVKVVDQAGNEVELRLNIDSLKQLDNLNEITNNDLRNTIKDKIDEINKDNKEEGTNNPNGGNSKDDNKEEWDIPKISLDDLPANIIYQKDYKLPSSYDFGNDGGTLECLDNNKVVTSTKDMLLGPHVVECTITSNHNNTTRVSKKIYVEPEQKDSKVQDGYMWLTLYYPEESTERMYRYEYENEVDDGTNGWIDYTGPILVKIDDIEHIFIKYKLDDEEMIEAPGKYILIEPVKYKVENDEKTIVKLRYSKGIDKVTYRLNGGSYKEYSEPFEVGANTLIDAKIEWHEDKKDNLGNVILTKQRSKEAHAYVSGPDDPKYGVTPRKFFGIALKTNALNNAISQGSLANVWAEVLGTPKKIEYRINDGEWNPYTQSLNVGINTIIEARAIYDEQTLYTSLTINEAVGTIELYMSKTSPCFGGTINEVKVTLSTNEPYDTLEYSTDGINYLPYENELVFNSATSVYGRARKTYTDGTIATRYQKLDIPYQDVIISFYPYEDKVLKGHTTKVGLGTNLPVDKILYSLDGVNYHDYVGRIELGANKPLYAKALYLGNESEVFTFTLPQYEILKGPTFTQTPTENTYDGVFVELNTEEEADTILYRINDGKWIEYTDSIYTTNNIEIDALYYRKSDGLKSETTTYNVQNIRDHDLPLIKFTNDTDEETYANVQITCDYCDQDTLEYSFDGNIYTKYQSVINLDRSQTIYARASNEFGNSYNRLTVVLNKPPVSISYVKDLVIDINVTPSQKEVKGLINKAQVSINYDKACVNKYYRTGDDYVPYQGEFTLTSNATIYAYCNDGGYHYGESVLAVNYLTTGISAPLITVNPDTSAYMTTVSIEFAKNAQTKRYRIGNSGNYTDYTGPFEIAENTTIYAYNEDYLGNKNTSSLTIDNIIPVPQYSILDKGDYYLIKPNYPYNANVKEYKWLSNGTWKEYDDKGILLIKPEAINRLSGPDGIIITDDDGNDILYKDHYYLLDIPVEDISGSLFLRWNTKPLKAPEIVLNTDEVAKEVKVGIIYDKINVEKYYRIITEEDDTGWLAYNELINIDENNSIVYAYGVTNQGSKTPISRLTISNLDNVKPTIELSGDFVSPKRQVNVTVKANDDFGLDLIKWEKGKQNKNYFKENGNVIYNNNAFVAKENDTYTVYAIDKVGNEVIADIDITNIDLNAPNITITLPNSKSLIEQAVSIDYGDSVTKEYKIGQNGDYQEYTDEFIIKAQDVHTLKNDDDTITIYAKGTDEAGNVSEVGEVVETIDLKMPKKPVINLGVGYPLITEYGIKMNTRSTIIYDDTRDDLVNEYSLDNGETWKIYNGPFDDANQKVIARSTTKSGLVIETIKEVTQPTDALGYLAYDDDVLTYDTVYGGTHDRYIYVDPSVVGSNFTIDYGTGCSTSLSVIYYDNDNIAIKSDDVYSGCSIEKNTATLTIPNNTVKMNVRTHQVQINWELQIYELKLDTTPNIKNSYQYPKLTEEGMIDGYNNITINYYNTSVQKLYKIDDGEWQTYKSPVKLILGQTITAKGIDKNNNVSLKTYISEAKSDSLSNVLYDGNDATLKYADYTERFDVDPLVRNKEFKYIVQPYACGYWGYYAHAYLRFYDNNNYLIKEIDFIDDKKGSTDCGARRLTNNVVMPNNAHHVIIQYKVHSGVEQGFCEIGIINKPSFTQRKEYPTITLDKIEKPNYPLTIYYLTNLINKEYSIDNGETWIPYKGEIQGLNLGTKVQARASIRGGGYTEIGTYTIEGISDAIETPALDNDFNTSMPITAGNTKYIGIKNDLYGKTLRIYTASTTLENKINLYDKDDNIIDSFDMVNPLTTVKILENTVKLGIVANSNINLTEIEIRPDLARTNVKNPKITVNTNSYAQQKVVDIVYPNGYVNQYSLDKGVTWNNYTDSLIVKSVTTVLARTLDSNNKVASSSSFLVDNLRSTISFVSNVGDPIEPIVRKNEVIGELPEPIVKGLIFGGWYKEAEHINRVLSTDILEEDLTLYARWVGAYGETTTYNYDSTNKEQVITINESSDYLLEVWGAQGGNNGGYGGYSRGIIYLEAGTKLYINPGEMGSGNGSHSYLAGGYNGGGNALSDGDGNSRQASGGGATHIALSSGELKTFSSKQNDILIVAGGGAGKGYNAVCGTELIIGSGGGYIGGSSKYTSHNAGCGNDSTVGGGQEASTQPVQSNYKVRGTFGQGASADYIGGGGGYYGGNVGGIAGGGGSGYINNNNLSNKVMYCYNCPESTANGTFTISTTGDNADKAICPSGYSTTPISKCAKAGSGSARITLLTENYYTVTFSSVFGGNVDPIYAYNKAIGKLPKLTYENYEFAGWYKEPEYINEVNEDTIVDHDMTLYAKWIYFGDSTLYDYNSTNKEQVITINESSDYLLEVWGAQGGNNGGYGGYSRGIIYLEAGTKLYINPGEMGSGNGSHSYLAGGYNGGGNALSDGDGNSRQASGGGATHIALSSGELKTFSSKQNDILIVAGGGAGKGYNAVCGTELIIGSGGGYIGGSSKYTSHNAGCGNDSTVGGGQEASTQPVQSNYKVRGTFGQGASADYIGGGGGYYGGNVGGIAGGGGSGYINNNNLSNKVMYCYNCPESTANGTFTISTTGDNADKAICPSGYSTTPISKCAKAGSGSVKITKVYVYK